MENKKMLYQQRTLDFDAPVRTEAGHVTEKTSEPTPADQGGKPPPLVRPDRQLTYGGAHPWDWPDAATLHDADTITVDRQVADIDGPPHRLLICRGDQVEVYFAPEKFAVGQVLAIDHEREEVQVQFPDSLPCYWFYKGQIYPLVETDAMRSECAPTAVATEAHVDHAQDHENNDGGSTPAAAVRPYTFADFKSFHTEQPVTFEQFQAEFQRIWDSQDALRAELVARFKAKQLAALALRFGGLDAQRCTKQENAARIVQKMLASFVLDGSVSYSPFSGETYELAIKKKVAALDAGTYYRHFELKQEQEMAREQALENPQNLADFRALINEQGEDALSEEQLARYDALRADLQRSLRAEQKANSTVQKFQAGELQDLSLVRKVGFHDKRECPLYIVQLESRVEREAFQELNRKAKQLGGWYSSFKKSDAGFQFLEQSQADRFCELLAGDVDRSDVLEARKERKELSAAESLHELANSLFLRAMDTLERSNDALQNTARRADIQAGVRGRAYADQALSRTIHSLAWALSRGEAKFLDGIRHKTELETLETVLHVAKWARVRAVTRQEHESTYSHGLKQDRVEEEPISLTTIRFVEFPYPTIYRRHLEEAIQQGRLTKGVKKAAETLHKYAGSTAAEYVAFSRQYELDALFEFLERAKAHDLDVERIAAACQNYQRLVRANITCLPELRAALREYLAHRAEQRGDDPVQTAERELIGKDLPGFFPTPRPVIERMLELADIAARHHVLEPSCGKGDILDALRELHPELSMHAVERNRTLSDVLAAKGYEVAFSDFLTHNGVYDRIVMNPPFDDEMAHVRHAYSLLAPGGRLVSVISEGPFFRRDRKASEFREWLDQVSGQSERLPENAFGGQDAFRKTGVRTRLIRVDKPC